jgi:predicted dehydrogenase
VPSSSPSSLTEPSSGVRAAVVGAGLMGRWHARELVRAGGTLAGVMDRSADAARAISAEPALATDDLAELLALRPEVVHVCTPLDAHAEQIEAALAAGAHVLCEKPLTVDTAETERLLGRAASAGRMLVPVHQYLFQPGFERALAALPRIVPLLHADTIACSAGGEGHEDLDAVVAEILPHPLAVLERLLPDGLASLEWRADRPRAGELRATSASPSAGILVSLGGRPTRNELRLIGARGTVHVDFFHGFAVVEGDAVSRTRKITHPFVEAGATAGAAALNLAARAVRGQPAYPGLRELIAATYAAVRGGGPPPVSAAETVAVARARDTLVA